MAQAKNKDVYDFPAEEEGQPETTKTTAVTRRINSGQYREISSFDQALALARETYGNIEQASAAIGDGFQLLEEKDKTRLIGVPFLILSYGFSPSPIGKHREFVSVRLVTNDNRKIVINDGGSGIYEQLKMYNAETGREGGLFISRGLRVSEYLYEEEDPKTGEVAKKPAKTFYLDTAA